MGRLNHTSWCSASGEGKRAANLSYTNVHSLGIVLRCYIFNPKYTDSGLLHWSSISNPGDLGQIFALKIHLANILFGCLSTQLHFPRLSGAISAAPSVTAFGLRRLLGNRLGWHHQHMLIQMLLPVYLWEGTQPPSSYSGRQLPAGKPFTAKLTRPPCWKNDLPSNEQTSF